ncbi:uncharacterized protein B0H18DRAFT_1124688 [Fomitopsis serialis]|uniref:uncharacterized protein n=1 Tax=Fomitopsis serialis TaxID=139415 RepID=UPI0020076C99|nr:uncharacterized protein B0H18DRAFT_1124688 [Neoantrodia serialis]KAH9915736.1 hypothetical protein B0H18DRAFT_1124688 [Neoantrodia serialis]
MDSVFTPPPDQDDLTSYFDKSATTVRELMQRLENNFTRPLIQYALDAFRQHPIRSTYLAILTALSLLPALSFIGFSFFIFTSFICTALAAALVAATAVVAIFGTLLLGTLFLLVGVSILLTASIIGIYLFVRLALLTYDAGPRAGIKEWAHQSRTQLLPSRFHSAESLPTRTRLKTGEGRFHDELDADSHPFGKSAGSQEEGLAGDGAVGADLGSPPTVAKTELEKEEEGRTLLSH